MLRWFRRDPDDEFEDDDEADAEDLAEPAEPPAFALIVAATEASGWHMAAVIGETANPDFYVRALAVRWPFLIARPVPSNRISDRRFDRAALSPTGTTPARKLVVNWAWDSVEESVSQLRFYVKRTAPRLFRKPGSVVVRLTLKESTWMRRRIVIPVRSNAITWNPSAPGTPASPPRQST